VQKHLEQVWAVKDSRELSSADYEVVGLYQTFAARVLMRKANPGFNSIHCILQHGFATAASLKDSVEVIHGSDSSDLDFVHQFWVNGKAPQDPMVW